MASSSFLSIVALLLTVLNLNMVMAAPYCGGILAADRDRVLFALNLEFLEAEFFLYGALGQGLDAIAPNLTKGGPTPTGARKANLDFLTRRIIEEFAYQEVGHLRAITSRQGGFPRPLIDLSAQNFAKIFDQAIGSRLNPPFDPYSSSTNFLLASYLVPYVGLVGYVGTIPSLLGFKSRRLVASLLGVESGQDAVIRTLLYTKANQKLSPYNLTVAQFTDKLSEFRNQLAQCGNKDEGLIVPSQLGAENRTSSNVLSADSSSQSYSRNPQEILRIVYGTGDESKSGGFFPLGGNGIIAKSFLQWELI